jgi:hypothetical protein
MNKSATIMELVAGYDAYSDVTELSVSATADAPGTSPFCASLGASYVISYSVADTIHDGC